jgi:hypothetical protein
MSLIDIEKNDVDISKLFAYKKEITLLIPGTSDEVTFYQRVVGDEDNNKARVYALRESGKLRSKLNDRKWEDRVAYVPDISKVLKDDLVEITLGLIMQDLSMQALNETTLKEPKQPKGDATLEEQEEYQEAIDNYKKEFNEKVTKTLGEKVEEKRKLFSKFTKDELVKMYGGALIDQHCQERFGRAYLEQATFYGTYVDKEYTTRAFKTFEDFKNAPSNLKDALTRAYSDIQLGGVALKKLRGVTP